ncbi:hypothetical protein [Singulisphaera acidiphila]|uniref:Uncharacterized protein n=1 Tax=Singulisphaera acidiphila (strain ATCC BAA-1392 / DSM 18658 / VKM B-2454 / MOB10) TaxID=886293 RepID=L0DQW4_SINAD|nr:hypothetical protein [Singulisphaera acidiphila]AGA31375.1 hypothetical protein Sinac_7336 [Singulisphaera acidiphila DSM 18658]
MKWKPSLLLLFAALTLALLPTGCGQSTAPISPEEAKAIVGEDPDYLPNAGADKKAAKNP